MGNSHKVSHDQQTASQLKKQKQQLQFLHNDFIREFEGDIQDQYQILNPPLVSNDFYELRKAIYKKTKICKAMFIINKYKVRTQQRELLEEQINKLKRIDNPYLLKIYELNYDKHRFYIICEFCYGQSLAQILVQERSVSERKAARIMHQLLNVLAECHRNSIIHTDLKLQNITFNSKDEEVIKITDFSISRIFRVEDVVAQSRRKAFLAAPQTLNGEPVSKSDIWSCGIILYIILSGQIPIVGTTLKRLRQKMLYYNPNFAHEEFKYVSKQAKKLIKMMLNDNPSLRPSAQQCLNHPWFQKYYQPIKISDSTFKRILNEGFNFNPSSKLQEACWGLYVNAFISFDEKQSILHAFSELDDGSKNHITQQDLKRGFLKFYGQRRAEFLSSYIYRRHKGKTIKFSQFLAMCTNRSFLINIDNTKNLFKIFDEDGNGQIQLSQLRAVLGASKQIPQQIWMQLMKEADQNSDGVISYEQFTHLMKQLQNTTNQALLQAEDNEIS